MEPVSYDRINQPEGRCGLAETLVEPAYGASQHLNYHAHRDTTKFVVFKCWAFIVPTLVTVIRWSPPAGNSKCFRCPAAPPLTSVHWHRVTVFTFYK